MEVIYNEEYGMKYCANIQVLGDFLDSETPEYTWIINFKGVKVEWKTCKENCGDFVYDDPDEAKDAAFDYLIDHYSEFTSEYKEDTQTRKENQNAIEDLERDLYLDEIEKLDCVEEIPEDFRMNNVN